MEKSKVILALGICLLMTLLLAQAEAQTFTVSGQVTGANGEPRKYVRVEFEGPVNSMSMTDDKGNFSINNLQPGNYYITVKEMNNIQKFTVRVGADTGRLRLAVSW